jgi:hypothetical protein
MNFRNSIFSWPAQNPLNRILGQLKFNSRISSKKLKKLPGCSDSIEIFVIISLYPVLACQWTKERWYRSKRMYCSNSDESFVDFENRTIHTFAKSASMSFNDFFHWKILIKDNLELFQMKHFLLFISFTNWMYREWSALFITVQMGMKMSFSCISESSAPSNAETVRWFMRANFIIYQSSILTKVR